MGAFRLGACLALGWWGGVQVEPAEAPADERLYGRVTTAGGRVLEGYLRWDRNEATWSDFLDGLKEIPWEHLRELEVLDPDEARRARRERSIEAFGVRITWDRDDGAGPVRVGSAIRFGHIESLLVLDDRRARLSLRSGGEVVLHTGSTDLGRGMRGLVVDDPRGSEVELDWRDLDLVEFLAAPAGTRPIGARLHGTVTTRSGAELTGYVSWDLDEAFDSDVLDGEGVDDRVDHSIEFRSIAAIEQESSRSARVVLRDGTEIVLQGTNDVDRSNRGIEVSDPTFGRAIVPWDAFDVLVLHDERASSAGYADFVTPGAMTGTVRTVDGVELSGAIRWDNDETEGWEIIDGSMDGVDYDVELGRIRSIERRGSAAAVTLDDGRVLELSGTNDVDRDNQGIVVTSGEGRATLVRWRDFDSVVFEW